MAKTEEKKDALVKEDPKALAMARPSFIEESRDGTEGIGLEDIRLPRLAIAQGLSDQMTPGNSKYLENLKLFELFNDLSGDIYGKGPLEFIVCRRDVRRIEFVPREQGGGVKDLNVPYRRPDGSIDPRNEWSENEKGERVPPAATKYTEFVILLLLPNGPEPIVLSIKDTNKWQRAAALNLSSFISMRRPPAPIYAGLYTVRTTPEKNDSGTFGVYVIENAGYVQDKALYDFAKSFSDSLKGKTIVVDREPGDEDEESTPTGGAPVSDGEKPPF